MLKDLTVSFFAVWLAAFLVNGLPDVIDGTPLIYGVMQSLGFAVLGLVFSFVTLIINRKSPTRLRYALMVGVLGVAIPAFAGQISNEQPVVKSSTLFQPDGCEFSVEFPALRR